MRLSLIGVNHKKAGLERRERFSLAAGEAESALAVLAAREEVAECFLLSTCNRTELYLLCREDADPGELLSGIVPAEGLLQLCYRLENEEAVRHLFAVAAGLDSMVLGETEIIGQLRESYLQARATGACGPVLGALCESALAAGKKAQSETGIGRNAVSYGYAAACAAQEMFGSLSDRTLMVIGTGEMAGLVLQNMLAFGIGKVLVAGRHRERGEALAGRFNAVFVAYKSVEAGLAGADVVLCATNAPHWLLTREMVAPLQRDRSGRPLLVVDLGVPRNVEPSVVELPGVTLLNLDGLAAVIRENVQQREREAARAVLIIEDQAREFCRNLKVQRAGRFIAHLQRSGELIRRRKLEEFAGRLSGLDGKVQKAVEKLTRSLVTELCRQQVDGLKALALRDDYEAVAPALAVLFGLRAEQEEASGAGGKD